MQFEDKIIEPWDTFNGKTYNKILTYCIPIRVWIKEKNNQSGVLMKFVLALTYNIYLRNLDIDYINNIAQAYGKISRIVAL